MLETHPFGSFVPKSARYLILGSFTGKNVGEKSYDWFYGTKRNQFWPILEAVYSESFITRKDKEKLFSRLKIAIADIIYQCERMKSTNLDANLTNIVYNFSGIAEILQKNNIDLIFFSSRFVENKFRQHFKNIIELFPKTELVTLPSPSPRFAKMRLEEKVREYKKLLPRWV